ncbi:DUF6338 family protein [Fusobacterium sp. THCT1E2]
MSLNDILDIFPYFALGFISTKIWELITPTNERNAKEIYMEILVYGIIYKKLDDVLSFQLYNVSIPISKVITFGLVLSVPFILKYLLQSKYIKPLIVKTITPTSWDYIFSRQEPCLIAVHFIDKEIPLIGLYSENSFVSSFPHKKDIYLEKEYQLKDGKYVPIELSGGIFISPDNIKYIQFFKI